ncbi:hypothetical protein DJ82_05575 [Halorubrum sp. Ib24]|uniref:hypothetical protein n=1 Tax=unclassified Halorubrum TaxID=2642239 RepID=UPI000B990A57|nr:MULTISPECIES: hypothetical protein [unclassified Halorubrum]OYR39435.1 hypothetical protein DJ75_16330 [Halorubrum sp. Eb13]OYR41243.1 hypothetical protein DJ82_05575 [Halorubrum sp. Ib24]OYR45621.1 hypothetical protein DJ81_04400 [Halorubrum sp. Hd13]OYR50118.1 hypothetical protein DJ74_07145 [Halorubrum sp. Ea8]OYR52936.1 hypothetical protein DJ73_09265 [Halorubrum sp. Ea1]
MAVIHEHDRVEEANWLERVAHLAQAANPAFAAGSVIVPLSFVAAGVLLSSTTLLFYTHVAAGAVWFGFALIFPAVIGPTLGGLDRETAADVTTALTPKVVFFVLGFSLTTVVSGTILLGSVFGLGYGFSGRWPTLSLTLGWGLFVFGLLVPNRIHLSAYYESRSAEPDASRLEAIEKRNLVVGLLEAGAMLAIIVLMTGLRLG